MMRKYLLLLLLPITTLVKAQTVLEDQFQFNYLALNPAMTGARETFSLNAMLGNRFVGSIRPQQIYQLFSMDGPTNEGRGGLGLQAYNSNIDGFNNAGAKISYAYRQKFGDAFTMALGVDGGFIYQPVITSLGNKQLFPYAGLGGLLTSEKFFFSISKPSLITSKEQPFNTKKPLYTMVGISVGEVENTMLNLSAMLEANKNTKANFFLSAKVWIKKSVGLGLLYRSELDPVGARQNKVIPMAEFQFTNSFRLGASYDAKPLVYPTGTGSSTGAIRSGILQLYFRYDFLRDDSGDNRLKYY
ncbi:PorP/SprF family type IX secretion system membrane protein [Emticicia fontis]